jgi:glycosyltransferase involved in cell wall biosynthesis
MSDFGSKKILDFPNENRVKPTMIVYTPFIGVPPVGGPELYIMNTLKGMVSNFNVHLFVGSSPSSPQQLRSDISRIGIASSFFFKNYIFRNKVFAKIVRAFEAVGFSIQRRKEARALLALADSVNASAIWVIYGNTSFQLIRCIRRLSISMPIVLDTDSVWSDFIQRSIRHAPIYRRPAIYINTQLRRFQESRYLKYANSITAVSRIDQSRYEQITSSSSGIFVKPNVIDLDDYNGNFQPSFVQSEMYICLTGSFGHKSSAMDTSTKWFVDEIWPLICELHTELWLYIVGRNAKVNWSTVVQNRIRVFSDVKSTVPFIANSQAVIVPLLFESGTRFKILEAGALSRPVVTTSLGAEGLDVRHREHLYVAESAIEFAESVSLAYRDNQNFDLGKNLNNFVTANHTVNSLEPLIIMSYDFAVIASSK